MGRGKKGAGCCPTRLIAFSASRGATRSLLMTPPYQEEGKEKEEKECPPASRASCKRHTASTASPSGRGREPPRPPRQDGSRRDGAKKGEGRGGARCDGGAWARDKAVSKGGRWRERCASANAGSVAR